MTSDEIALQYASKIKSAIKGSGLTKSASLITESVKRDKILSVLKEIFVDINSYTKDKKPLPDSDKEYIFKLVGKKLGLSKPEKVYLMIKEASNDHFFALANYWSQFYEEIQL